MFALLIAGVIVTGCQDGGTSIKDQPETNLFLYKAYDPDKRVIVNGEISFIIDERGSVTGEWRLTQASSFEKTGPQIGSGKLEGALHNNEMHVNLNPGWADNNVLLLGRLERGSWVGTWSWVTFVGPTSGGAFVATPR